MTEAAYLEIPVRRRGKVVAHAKVDPDFPLAHINWTFDDDGYVIGSQGRGTRYRIHRVVLGLSKGDGLEGDHIDGDKLNNVRSNLRAVTRQQNGQNVPAKPGAASRYRAVYFTPNSKLRPWRARPGLAGKYTNLGNFATELEAHRAVTAWRAVNMPFANEDRSVA